jgi:hypothetical protein
MLAPFWSPPGTPIPPPPAFGTDEELGAEGVLAIETG